jgi:hypothetical protein
MQPPSSGIGGGGGAAVSRNADQERMHREGMGSVAPCLAFRTYGTGDFLGLAHLDACGRTESLDEIDEADHVFD